MNRYKVVQAYKSDPFTQQSESVVFWSYPITWPRESEAYVFLGSVVHDIGELIFQSEWTFDEPITVLPKFLSEESTADIRRAKTILRALDPDFEWRTEAASEHVKSANDLIAERFTDAILKTRRYEQVQGIIATACQDGKLVCKTRSVEGGPMDDLHPDIWNTDRLYYRFQFCQIDPSDPFAKRNYESGQPAKGGNHKLVFITRKSLQSFTDELRQTQPSPHHPISIERRIHLSPYMEMMLEVIESWEISPTNQPPISSLENYFSKMWAKRFPERKPLSLRLAGRMATLVREPESQQGRAAKKR
jgi:hypothetical protein